MTDNVSLTETFDVEGGDFPSAGEASTHIKNLLKKIGFSREVIRKTSIVAYESEMNIVLYAKHGSITVDLTPDRITLNIRDKGPGIEDVDKAMQEGYSTADDTIREMGFGAGMGLPNIKKNSDRFEIEAPRGKGTCLEVIIECSGKLE